MSNVQEEEGLLSHLLFYMDAIIIDWDDMESRDVIQKAFRLVTPETPVSLH